VITAPSNPNLAYAVPLVQLVVQVPANERNERSASRMNPADRQPRGNLGNPWVIGRQNVELQLGRGFDGEAGVLPSKPCPLRLAAAVDAEQDDRREGCRGGRNFAANGPSLPRDLPCLFCRALRDLLLSPICRSQKSGSFLDRGGQAAADGA
jgi:hypothetical protein